MCHILRLKATSCLKGDICGNLALQGRKSLKKSIRLEDGPRLEDVTNLYGAGYESSVLQTAFLIILASSPALKGGVTIDNAFQAFFMRFCNSPFFIS